MFGEEGSPRFDRDKFKALVHYIIWKCPDPSKLGSTKLNKILWFSDARAYMLHRKSITGATYIREKYGPVPHQIMPVRDEMQRDGLIRISRQPLYNHDQDIFTTDRKPDLSRFSSDEMQIVDFWVGEICERHTADTASKMSHDYAWEIAGMGEEVPFYALRANRIKELTDREFERLRQRAKELRLI